MISHKPDTWQTKGTQSKAFRSASLGEKNFPPSDMTGDADITMQRDWLEKHMRLPHPAKFLRKDTLN